MRKMYRLSIDRKIGERKKPGCPDASCKSKQSYNKMPNLLESGNPGVILNIF